MEPQEIGDITFVPTGERLFIRIAEGQDWSTWSVAGAQAAIAYLLAWVHMQSEAQDSERSRKGK
jgi:hypothetical protein